MTDSAWEACHYLQKDSQQLSALPLVPSLPQSVICGPVMRYQLSSSYLSAYFPHNMERVSDVGKSRYIISGITALPQKSPMLENVLAALSCIFLGKSRNDKHVFRHGLRLYNIALQYMAISISRGVCSDTIVYTCVIFLQIQTFDTPIMAAIYGQYSKLKVLLAGLMHLSEETITWINDYEEDSPLQEWMYILTEISRIAIAIDTTDSSDHNAYKSLLAGCLSLEKKNKESLCQINQSPNGEPPTFARWELNSGIPSTDDLFGPAYCFSSLYEANLHIFFWLTLSFIYPLIRQCQILAWPDDIPHCDHFIEDEAHHLSMDWERFVWGLDVLTYLEISGFDNAARFREIWSNYWSESHKHSFYRMVNYREVIKGSAGSV
ncbi:hypothetical protein BDW59DRAFT_176569 [Aspergillus cavernicola]|uniref:Uncharacterized protein n=1 Tax=Aspergillus cavernicola TaxID=176166 RepID=A0ABR4HF02_9EURO